MLCKELVPVLFRANYEGENVHVIQKQSGDPFLIWGWLSLWMQSVSVEGSGSAGSLVPRKWQRARTTADSLTAEHHDILVK